MVAEGARLTILEQVLPAEGKGIDAHLRATRSSIDSTAKVNCGPPGARALPPRHLVGIDPLGHRSDGRYAIAGGGAGAEVGGRTEGAVGPGIEDGMNVHRLQAAVGSPPTRTRVTEAWRGAAAMSSSA